jgi:bilirubin oxidase
MVKERSMKVALSVSFSILLSLTLSAVPSGAAPLNPTTIPKYQTELFRLPTMPNAGTVDYYEIAEQQFLQQVLPVGFPLTTVWGYGAINTPGSFHYPSYTIEAAVNIPVRVKWINNLKNAAGNFLPHLFAADLDQTFHWANPPQQCADGTTRPDCAGTSGAAYTGPVPIVVHLHGSHVDPESDGFPEAWYLPAASDIPAGYATRGSDFNQVAGAANEAGAAVFQYRNDQRATTLWFHDHTLGLTRLNVYAGPVGFYLLRGGPNDLPAGVLPAGAYEIPMVIQAKSFQDTGALDFGVDGGEGNTTVVNGNTWPFVNVEPRRYRFRFLNASNANPYNLVLASDVNGTPVPDRVWQIGADGGFLPAPVLVPNVLLHIAERADVIIDFAGLTQGTVLYLVNNEGTAATTGQVVQFRVGALTSAEGTTPANALVLPTRTPLGAATFVRKVSVNDGIGAAAKLLGTVDNTGLAVPMFWADNVTENPQFGATEIWQIHNFEGSDHPIHIHQVQFEILGRRALGSPDNTPLTPPLPGETGTKDTVIVGDGQIVHVKALFDIGGKYVWHCHILEHEDDEMMRPFEVAADPSPPPPPPPPPPIVMTTGGGGGGGSCAMAGTKGGIKEIAGAYGALILLALGMAFRRRLKRRDA